MHEAPLDPAASAALIADPDGGMARLLEIMRRLRDPATGCPWDIEQTFATIAPYTIEEAHEVADAIERKAWDELPGELGDLLLQTVYHAQIGAEAGLFTFDDGHPRHRRQDDGAPSACVRHRQPRQVGRPANRRLGTRSRPPNAVPPGRSTAWRSACPR